MLRGEKSSTQVVSCDRLMPKAYAHQVLAGWRVTEAKQPFLTSLSAACSLCIWALSLTRQAGSAADALPEDAREAEPA